MPGRVSPGVARRTQTEAAEALLPERLGLEEERMQDPKIVAPTLVEAVGQLAHDRARGFVFVKPDGTERFCSFHDIHAEATRRGAHLAARGLKKGDRLAMVIPDGDEFVLSFLGAIFAGVVPVPIYPQLSFKNVESYHDT